MSDSLRTHGLSLARLLRPWHFPGKNTGVGCHFLLQGIFPTQGSNLHLLHCRRTLPLSHQGSPGTNYSAPNLSINPASPSSYSRPFKMDLESSHVNHCYYSCYPQTPTAFSPTPHTCPLFPSQQPDGAWRQPFSPGPLQPNGFPDLPPWHCPTPLYHSGCLTPRSHSPWPLRSPPTHPPTTELCRLLLRLTQVPIAHRAVPRGPWSPHTTLSLLERFPPLCWSSGLPS